MFCGFFAAPWNAIARKGIDTCASVTSPSTPGCSKPRTLHAISTREGVGTHQRPGTVALCCRLRRHNPGCLLMRQQMIVPCQIAGGGRGGMGDTVFLPTRREQSSGSFQMWRSLAMILLPRAPPCTTTTACSFCVASNCPLPPIGFLEGAIPAVALSPASRR
jgi:hypothetical protein